MEVHTGSTQLLEGHKTTGRWGVETEQRESLYSGLHCVDIGGSQGAIGRYTKGPSGLKEGPEPLQTTTSSEGDIRPSREEKGAAGVSGTEALQSCPTPGVQLLQRQGQPLGAAPGFLYQKLA